MLYNVAVEIKVKKSWRMIMNNVMIRYSKDALKFLSRLDKKSVTLIREAITGIALETPSGDIKTIKGYTDGRKRLRVGSWRVIYKKIDENMLEVILVIDIGNRGDIYK